MNQIFNPPTPFLFPLVKIMNALVQSGQIRRWGTSNWSVERTLEAVNWAQRHDLVPPSVVSNQYSLAVPCAPIWPGTTHLSDEGQWYFSL
jgi:aryl-alcohol dehydrogenase-like predicted oxidoreductase